jgi:hypothetical protein
MLLGFAGLVGAVLVGVVADAAISWASRAEDEDADGTAPDPEAEPWLPGAPEEGGGDAAAARGDLTDWADPSTAGEAGPVARAEDDAPAAGGEQVMSLSDVTEGDDPAMIDDFDAETDHLVVVYDPELHPDPALTLEPMPDGGGMTVMLDGVPLAEIPGATDLRPEQVRLKPSMPLAA